LLIVAGATCKYVVRSFAYRTILSPEGSLAIVRNPPAANFRLYKLPSYDPTSQNGFQVDLRGGDVSNVDLQGRLTDLMHANFDDRTIWPANLPDGFDPQEMMNLGRNPGLRVRELHQRGIVGKGVGIGIIDQGLLVDHVEYRDRLRLYEEIHCQDNAASMHGAAVSSIAVGKTVGVAPEADLYFIAETHGTWSPGSPFKWDFHWLAKSIDRLLEINRTLPPDRKIRVISISVGWDPQRKGFEEANRAVERAKKENVFVISTSLERTHKLAFHGLGRDPLKDPDHVQSYGPGSWWREQFFKGTGGWSYDRLRNAERPRLMVPMDSRCIASPCGPEQYVFYANGGWSWSVPYLAGLYALACEVNPTVTPEEFWSIGLETGKTITIERDGKTYVFGKIVDPVALIDVLTGEAPTRQTAIPRDQAER
jgi:hypothetical protein